MVEELEPREFTAGTVEEAINKACDYFNVMDNRLSYEVVKSSTRGILRSKKFVTIVAKPLSKDEKPIEKPVGCPELNDEFVAYATGLVGEILNSLGLQLKAEHLKDEGRFVLNISGPDRMYILNRRAEVLESLQFILNKIAVRQPHYTKILLDSNGYRGEKEHQLVQLAHSTAMKVKRQKRPLTLEPLNSYERRIIHMTLADDKEVITTSKGNGHLKRITISMS